MPRDEALESLRPVRLVVLAMGVALLAFAAFALVMVTGGRSNSDPAHASMLLILLGGIALAEIPAYLLVRKLVLEGARRAVEGQVSLSAPPATAVRAYGILTLIVTTLVAGVGLFGVVVFLITGHWFAMAAPALALALLVVAQPGKDKLDGFLMDLSSPSEG